MMGRMSDFFNGGEKDGSGQRMGGMMNMCSMMMKSFWGADERATSASTGIDPEMKSLFDEWAAQVESEILSYVNETKSIDSIDISLKLKISVRCAKYFIEKLIKENKINL